MSVETMLQEGSKDRNPVTEKLRDAFITVLKNQRSTALDTVASLAAEREVLSDRIAQLTSEILSLKQQLAAAHAAIPKLATSTRVGESDFSDESEPVATLLRSE